MEWYNIYIYIYIYIVMFNKARHGIFVLKNAFYIYFENFEIYIYIYR
jgi:hypothetical protein